MIAPRYILAAPTLADPAVLSGRRAALAAPHMVPLARFAGLLRERTGRPVPDAPAALGE